MPQMQVARTINASPEIVFRTVSDIRQMAKALPHVVGYEFLTEPNIGKGTRFRETRMMEKENGKVHVTELEITEYVEPERVRMVADNHGTIWDTVFTVASTDDATILTINMNAKAYKLFPRLINPLIKGMITRAMEKDIDLIKEYCEQNQNG